jgi:transketolase
MQSAAKINQLKLSIIKASFISGEGHIPSAFSILDILFVLYDHVLKFNNKDPLDSKRDRFILSKGHGSLGLYAILANKKFFDKKHLETFGQFNSILGGHPDSLKVPGVEVSTGTLGHGFPTAVGVALGLKIKKNPASVYTLIGDGESNEGTIWEAALLASHHKLDNLICIIDHNHSTDRAVSVDDLEKKFKAFDWATLTINGHDHSKILKALKLPHRGKPLAIIANTIKGYGIKEMEGEPAWHHKSPTKEEYEKLTRDLKQV